MSLSLARSLLIALVACVVYAEDYNNEQYYGGNSDYNNGQANYNYNNAAQGDDDGMQGYNDNYANQQQQQYSGDDYIKYWTDYQIVAKRCIVYNNVDQILFQVFSGSDHCSSDPVGTYVTAVPYYMQGYLAEIEQKNSDMGVDDYVTPDAAQYASCVPYETNSGYYWLQLGCADDTTQSLAVNFYSDNACTKRSVVDGYDDSTIDVSEVQVSASDACSRGEYPLSYFRYIAHTVLSRNSFRGRSARLASAGTTWRTTKLTITSMLSIRCRLRCAPLLGPTRKLAVTNASALVSRRRRKDGICRTRSCWRSLGSLPPSCLP